MYLSKAFQGKNHFWRYFVTIIIVFAATQVGAIPFTILLFVKALESGQMPDASDITYFEAMGIDPNLGLVLMVLPFLTGLIILLFLIHGFHKRTITDTLTGRKRFDYSRFWFGVSTWLILWTIVFVFHFIIEPGNFVLNFDPSHFFMLILITILFIPFQTSFEEVLFRGYLMQGLAVLSRNRWIPVLVTSLIFGLLHAFNPEVKEYGFALTMPQYLLFGLFFGIITIMDDGLELALGVHAINNMFLSIFFTHSASTLQTNALFEIQNLNPLVDLVELVLVSVIFILIVSRRFGWGRWRMLLEKVGAGDKEQH
jgi:membrane protease YdiL (CAAX protease family)